MTVIFRWGDLDHVPLYEGNLFVENDDHWWGSRCGTTDRVERGIFELSDGAPTCLWCIAYCAYQAHAHGRDLFDGAPRLAVLQARLKELASRLELNHGQKESAGGTAAFQDEACAEDQEHVVCPSTRRHRAH